MRLIFVCLMLVTLVADAQVRSVARGKWTAEQANAWYAKQPFLVGANFLPSSAINQLEMWQAATFDTATIARELKWAASIGMNTMRVFLHDLLWAQDAPGFKRRIDVFLRICARYGIKPLMVLFDSCWDPFPHTGKQHEPAPFLHNSGWVQGPGADALKDSTQYPRLQKYVSDIVASFRMDSRILGWDVWNEPDNTNGSSYGRFEPYEKVALVTALLPRVFQWTRNAGPVQPVTCGVWVGNWSVDDSLRTIERIQLNESDVISFHNYGPAAEFERCIQWLQRYQRPILCTEYMSRGNGSFFETSLPVAKRHRVAAFNWGLVSGKSQTIFPWDSWSKRYTAEPELWFHDVFRQDGSPYRPAEVELIRSLSTSPSKVAQPPTPQPPTPQPPTPKQVGGPEELYKVNIKKTL